MAKSRAESRGRDERNPVTRRGFLGMIGGVSTAALLAACGKQPEETTTQPSATATESPTAEPTPSATASETETTSDVMPIPGYTNEEVKRYRQIMDLPYNDFIQLPKETQLAAIYATYLHEPVSLDRAEGDIAWTISGEANWSINGQLANSIVPGHLDLSPESNAADIVTQTVALEYYATVADKVSQGRGDVGKKMLAMVYELDENGEPTGQANGYISIVAQMDDPKNQPPNSQSQPYGLKVEATGRETTDDGHVILHADVLEESSGEVFTVSCVSQEFDGPNGTTLYAWQIRDFSMQNR